MINPCVFDPIALEAWYSDEESSLFIQTELEKYLQNYSSCFCSEPQRKLFRTFIRGLLSSLDRKSIEPIALHFSGVKYVRPLQQFFSRSPFKEQSLLDIYQELLSEQVVEENGMLSVDDTGFVKKGKHSAGVKRQYCGRLGKTENCQSGVFLAYAGKNGYGLVDCELSLPQEWFSQDFAQLYKECRIPEDKEFSTKNEIAQRMLNRAMCSGLFQARWVGCDAAYGNDHDFLDGLELPKGVWYFAATNAKEQVFREYPEMFYPERGRGRPRKHPVLSGKPVSVQEIAEEPSIPWETDCTGRRCEGTDHGGKEMYPLFCLP